MFRKAAFAAIVHSLHLQSSLRRFPVRGSTFSASMGSSPLQECRDLLRQSQLDAFIVGSGDSHQSEYVSSHDMRRQFLSGFTGSAGTALILDSTALLWTDGRYFLQANQELSKDWQLMKSGESGVLELPDWLAKNLKKAQALQKTLNDKGIELVSVEENPVDIVWARHNRRPVPCSPIAVHDIRWAGVSHTEKIANVQSFLRENDASALVVSMLDEVAWLFNIRGSDVQYNPVVISYAVVTLDKAYLFVDASKVNDSLLQQLGNKVEVRPYDAIEKFLISLAGRADVRVLVDPSQLNWRLYRALGSSAVSVTSPIALSKSCKNDAELKGVRDAHIRDGAALTAFLYWLEGEVTVAPNTLKETDAMQKLEEFRGRNRHHVGPSFATIAGYGANGAIIHYHSTDVSALPLGVDNLFLLDSGAQYLDGTTDVTRTLHFGTPTQHMKDCYTAVLKGHIAMARMIFPSGTAGSRFDCVARQFLWRQGLDYNHGTGHGVGAYLNVHEGPQGVGPRGRPGEKGFCAGMTISNEPGYYEDGAFGIRIENVCIAVPFEAKHRFNNKSSLSFETVTKVPIQTSLIDVDQLSEEELLWINEYHSEVRRAIEAEVREVFPEAVDYLIDRTKPISR